MTSKAPGLTHHESVSSALSRVQTIRNTMQHEYLWAFGVLHLRYGLPFLTIFRAHTMLSPDFDVYMSIISVSILVLHQYIKKGRKTRRGVENWTVLMQTRPWNNGRSASSRCLIAACTSVRMNVQSVVRTRSKCMSKNLQSTDYGRTRSDCQSGGEFPIPCHTVSSNRRDGEDLKRQSQALSL